MTHALLMPLIILISFCSLQMTTDDDDRPTAVIIIIYKRTLSKYFSTKVHRNGTSSNIIISGESNHFHRSNENIPTNDLETESAASQSTEIECLGLFEANLSSQIINHNFLKRCRPSVLFCAG